ncbi:NAC domain containing protein 25 [Hibiscus syriacus]|uniref:NAC domain containing protein 25 n=1 Tax=Hibiscus syriacus TaxID=106335 RepID=A0A6A3ABG5_HIBSY|nr:NAC domain containing protein 25 [Hibiscus syriacus]
MTATAGGRSRLRNFLEGAGNGGGRRLVTNGNVTELVVENAVIVFGRRGCMPCGEQAATRLGVNPAVCESTKGRKSRLNELSVITVGFSSRLYSWEGSCLVVWIGSCPRILQVNWSLF